MATEFERIIMGAGFSLREMEVAQSLQNELGRVKPYDQDADPGDETEYVDFEPERPCSRTCLDHLTPDQVFQLHDLYDERARLARRLLEIEEALDELEDGGR